MRLLVVGIVAGCMPIPPPPMIPSHVSTAPETRGATTVMLVFGVAGQALGGGFGLAVRAEHQETDHTTLGVELGGGRGDEAKRDDGSTFRHGLLAIRGYGRFSPGDHDWTALTYGAGLSIMRSGMVTGTLHGGASVAYVNGYAVPTLNAGLALAVPLIGGDAFGDTWTGPNFGEVEPEPPKRALVVPHTRLSVYLDAGLVVPIERASLSLDVGAISPLNDSNGAGLLELSVASGARL